MTAPAQTNTSSSATNNGPLTSFADMVDYPKMFDELSQRGIDLTAEEKRRVQKICGDGLRKRDGGSVFGNGLGLFESIPYMLIAFFQNIPKLLTGNFNNIGDIFSQLGSTVSSTNEQTKLWQLQRDSAEIHLQLQAAGGNLAKAAEYITGIKAYSDNSPDKLLNASILNQVGKSINLPVDTDTSLNAKRVTMADVNGPGSLPSRSSRQGLTARG